MVWGLYGSGHWLPWFGAAAFALLTPLLATGPADGEGASASVSTSSPIARPPALPGPSTSETSVAVVVRSVVAEPDGSTLYTGAEMAAETAPVPAGVCALALSIGSWSQGAPAPYPVGLTTVVHPVRAGDTSYQVAFVQDAGSPLRVDGDTFTVVVGTPFLVKPVPCADPDQQAAAPVAGGRGR